MASCRAPLYGEARHTTSDSKVILPDTVYLANDKVRVGVSPHTGRIVDFGLAEGGRNLIWLDAREIDALRMADGGERYYNLGGDKLWPAPQLMWEEVTGHDSWPPDEVIDGQPWALLACDATSLIIESRPSPSYDIVVRRRIDLMADDAQIRITNTFRRIAVNPFPVCIWSVTQVQQPRWIILDIAEDRPLPSETVRPLGVFSNERTAGFFETHDGRAVVWRPHGQPDAKLGTFGRSIAAVYDDVIFLQQSQFDPHGAYLEASSIQAYHTVDYCELEVLSPLVQLAPGEELQNTVMWTLIPVSPSPVVRILKYY